VSSLLALGKPQSLPSAMVCAVGKDGWSGSLIWSLCRVHIPWHLAKPQKSAFFCFCIPVTVHKSQMTVHISQITIHIPQYIYSIYHRSQYIHQPQSFTNHQVFHKCCLHNTNNISFIVSTTSAWQA
jgi:hypothetical protein